MSSDILVGMMVASMVVVLLVSWRWFGSFRVAFITMLIVGKLWAGVLWAFGFDKPLFNISVRTITGAEAKFTVTAAEVVFITFLITLASVLFWPYIEREVGVRLW